MNYTLRMSGRQHATLQNHLFPGDGLEAVAVALCGRRVGDDLTALLVHELVLVPHAECPIRKPDFIQWRTDRLQQVIGRAASRDLAVVKIHSHPGGFASFSGVDDRSDAELFASVFGWMDTDRPHGSAIMLPGGRVFGRAALCDGSFAPFSRVSVAGDDLHFWDSRESETDGPTDDALLKNMQLFGDGTIRRLGRLSVAVVGYSGTGSLVVEALVRLGIGRILIVDFDVVKGKNLNRIANSTRSDANDRRLKVDVARRAIEAIGLGTVVETLVASILDPVAVRAVSGCDVLFGCVDNVEARQVMNRVASFYSMPYFDVGVGLTADGKGGIDQISGATHYLQPGGSSLLSREAITSEVIRAEGHRRANPEEYKRLLEEKYIKGVDVERPAVISVNMAFASAVVNDFLARVHPFRLDSNAEFAWQRASISHDLIAKGSDGDPCTVLAKKAGRGDSRPLLDLPELSESD